MGKWEEFSTVKKWATGISATLVAIVSIGGLLAGGYGHFSTDKEREHAIAEVRKEQKAHEQTVVVSSNRAEIWRAKREIKRLERDLEDPSISHSAKVRVENDINDYRDLIDCIREAKELCY